MARNAILRAEPDDLPLRWARRLLVTGLVAAGLTLFLPDWTSTPGVVVRISTTLAALLCAGGAVSLRLRFAGQEAEDRARSAGCVALAALAPLFAYAAANKEWDTFRLLLAVLTGVAVVGAVLLLLPRLVRRIVVSLLVLFHFGGILTAVASVPPPNGDAAWLVNELWTRVYRPYLQFMYLNNAYHFYSPQPGPPTLLWFYVEYSDGTGRWVYIPRREDFETRQEYQRRLAMTESVNQIVPMPPSEERKYKRLIAGKNMDPPIPPYPNAPEGVQFQEPQPVSKLYSSAYARYVAHHYPSLDNPNATVEAVKVYRVVHQMLSPGQVAAGWDPRDPTMYMPYYHGEFDPDGNLIDANDPFLYWLIPIVYMPRDKDKEFGIQIPHKPSRDEYDLVDRLKTHAQLRTRKAAP
jgi:hypothetical protein